MQAGSISLDQIVVQTKGNLVSNMDGEKVLMSINNGKYYNLGQVGGRIWEILESPSSVEQIVTELMAEYDVDRNTCLEQAMSFLQLLGKEGLIEVSEPAGREG